MVVEPRDDVLELYVGCGHPALADALPEDAAFGLSPVTDPPAALDGLRWVYRVVDGTAKVRWLQEEAWPDAAAGVQVMEGNPLAFAALRAICAVAAGEGPVRLFSRTEGSAPPAPDARPLAVDQIVPGELIFSGLWGAVPTCLYALEARE